RLPRLLDPSEFDLDDVPQVPALPADDNADAGQQAPNVVAAAPPVAPDGAGGPVVFSTRKVFDGQAVAQRMGLESVAAVPRAVMSTICELLAVRPADEAREGPGDNGAWAVSAGKTVSISAVSAASADSLPELSISWAWEEEELATRALAIVNRVLG
ncbi:hypothetical protein H4R19_006924, partial [Coemansia spiralis]